MLTRSRSACSNLVLAMLLASSVATGGEQPGKAPGDYLAAIKSQSAGAKQAGDVQQMVQCAYALYPLEAGADVKDKQAPGLLNAAADAVLAKKNATEAGRFLDLVGPIAHVLDADRRKKVEQLAVGESEDASVKTQAQRASEPLAKYGKDLADPDVQVRGSITRDIAEAMGMAVLAYCRPTCFLSEQKPYMADCSLSRPRSDRIELRVDLVFWGCFTGTRYQGVVRVVCCIDPIEVLYIRYSDNNPVPHNDPNAIADAINNLLSSR